METNRASQINKILKGPSHKGSIRLKKLLQNQFSQRKKLQHHYMKKK